MIGATLVIKELKFDDQIEEEKSCYIISTDESTESSVTLYYNPLQANTIYSNLEKSIVGRNIVSNSISKTEEYYLKIENFLKGFSRAVFIGDYFIINFNIPKILADGRYYEVLPSLPNVRIFRKDNEI